MRSACSVLPYCGKAAAKLENASGRDGRDSWLVKKMLGRIEEVVDLVKFEREIMVVVAGTLVLLPV